MSAARRRFFAGKSRLGLTFPILEVYLRDSGEVLGSTKVVLLRPGHSCAGKADTLVREAYSLNPGFWAREGTLPSVFEGAQQVGVLP